MRIAHLAWESLHSIAVGGLAVHVTEVTEALAAEGDEIHVFTRSAPGHAAHEVVDGVHYHRLELPGGDDFLWQVAELNRRWVDAVLRAEDELGRFDLVHAHDWLSADAMAWVTAGRPRPTVFTIHSTEYGRCGNNFYEGESARIRQIERGGLHAADLVIAVSEALKAEIMWMYELTDEQVVVIHNGVRAARFAGSVDAGSVRAPYGVGVEDPMVLFVGRLVAQKGPDLLLEAVPEVLEQFPTAAFVFTGDGYLLQGLEHRSVQLGVAGAVHFVGYTSDGELERLFKACDVVCVPSRNEPFGIVVLEAWSAGKPVVVSAAGGTDEFVDDGRNGVKVVPEPAALAKGLLAVLGLEDRGRALGLQGRADARDRFTWAAVARQTRLAYHLVAA
jgi:glycosyltransferase involved in cell wall biosynthesis